MRTLQEKYNGIQEGKFTKELFLAEARMQQPQLITRFNGYDDAVQILKNRGMIQETIKEAAQPKPTKKGLADYRYKPTNEMDKYPYEQILRGIRVELEAAGVHGTPTPEEYTKALAKVSKNLEKDSIFYTNQVAGVNPKVDLHDKMVPFTEKAAVDTFNGMKKAELKEGFKKLIKKVLSEEIVDVESYKLQEEDDVFEMYGEDISEANSEEYRGYEIKLNDYHDGTTPHSKYSFYNTNDSEESGGTGASVEDCKAQIDYIIDDRLDEEDLYEGKKSLSELLK